MAAPAITIWGADTTRSDLLRFACAEVGVPYEFKALDWAGGEHKGAAYLAIHPFGQVPAFKDGELLLTESGAALLYLAERYGKGSIGADSVEQRAVLARWLFLANTTLCDDLAKKNPRSCDVLSALLAKQDYICGADFTLADCAVAVYLAWMPYWTKCDKEWVLAERWPLLEAYKQRVLSRPAGVANVPLAWLEDTAAWLV